LPWRRLLWPGITTAIMLAVLVALGTWQLERLAWKEAILGQIAQAEAGPAVPLEKVPPPFAKVAAEGVFQTGSTGLYGAEVRDTARGPVMGAQLLVPLQRAGGAAPVLVDLGWVPTPLDAALPIPAGHVTVVGFARPEDRPGLFSARDDTEAHLFYTLNPAAIGAAMGLPSVEPFTLVALGTPRPGVYPMPVDTLPRPANNHLQYAITWYGLAVVLAVIFIVWARKDPLAQPLTEHSVTRGGRRPGDGSP
jgi:surfeit locus 1 family protein